MVPSVDPYRPSAEFDRPSSEFDLPALEGAKIWAQGWGIRSGMTFLADDCGIRTGRGPCLDSLGALAC